MFRFWVCFVFGFFGFWFWVFLCSYNATYQIFAKLTMAEKWPVDRAPGSPSPSPFQADGNGREGE